MGTQQSKTHKERETKYMTVQLAAVPFVGATIPNNRIMFSSGRTVEIELRTYRDCVGGLTDTITDKCFVEIWQNSANMGEVWAAVQHIKSRPDTDLWVSCYSYIKRRATRLRNLGVTLKSLTDGQAELAKQNEREEKEKKLNDLKELATALL